MLPYWMAVPWYRLGRLSARWVIASRFKQKLTIVGAEKIPRHGGVIIVANHLKAVDSVALGIAVPRQISFLAKSAYFHDKSFKGRLLTLGFWLIGQISVDRSGGKAMPAITSAVSRLKHGKVIGIHGEGTRSLDGLLYDMQPGFTIIARKSRATVVPAAFIYVDNVIEVHIGDPVPYSSYVAWNTPRFRSEITRRVQRLGGQTLAGRVATIVDEVRLPRKSPEEK